MREIGKFLNQNLKKSSLPRPVVLIILSSALVISSLKVWSYRFPVIYVLFLAHVVLLRKILPPNLISLVSGNIIGSMYLAFIFFELFILKIPLAVVLLHLLVFLQLGKLLSFYSAQDLYFLIFVSFGLILFAAVLSPGVITIIALLLFLYGFLEFSLLTRFRTPLSGLERRIEASGRAYSFSSTLAFLFLILICLSGMFYLLLPRPGTSMIRPGALGASSRLTGFSDNIELGKGGRIGKDSRVAMRVRMGKDEKLPAGVMGWRGTTMEYYDGRAWRRSYPGDKRVLDGRGDLFFLRSDIPAPPQEALSLEFFVEPAETNLLFLPAQTECVSGKFPGLFTDPSGAVFTADYYLSPIRYRVLIPSETADTRQNFPPSADYVRQCLRIPPLEPEVRALAMEWTRGKKTVVQKALAIQHHLGSGYTYTLEPATVYSEKTPLYEFLMNTRAGHCEYFATAMAVMLRSTGVPTRLVAGYTVGDYNPVGGYYLIRRSNAHTWVEVLVPGHGWVEFDPTPATAHAHAGSYYASTFGKARFYLDYAELLWSSHVMSYGMTRQLQVIGFLRHAIDRFIHFSKTGSLYLKKNPFWLLCPVLFIIAAVTSGFWIHNRRKGSSPSRDDSAHPGSRHPAAKPFAKLLRALEKRGRKRKPHETLIQYVLSVDDPFREEFREAAIIYNRSRFGKVPLTKQDSRFFKALLCRICAAHRNREGE